jgi:hypothetical protein
MDGEHYVSAREIQLIVATVDVNAFGIDHRAHRAIEDANAIFSDELVKLVHKSATHNPQSTMKKTSRRVTTRGLLRFPIVNGKTGFPVGSLAVFYVEQFAGNRHALIVQLRSQLRSMIKTKRRQKDSNLR